MFFRQRAAANATLSSFFGCAGHAKAVAVDVVAGDEDWFIAQAEQAGVSTSALLALQAPDQLRVDQQSIASPKCVDSGLGSTERSVDRLAPG